MTAPCDNSQMSRCLQHPPDPASSSWRLAPHPRWNPSPHQCQRNSHQSCGPAGRCGGGLQQLENNHEMTINQQLISKFQLLNQIKLMDTAGKTRLQAPFWKQYLPSMVPGVNLTAIMQSYTEKTKVCRYCSEIYPMKEKPCGSVRGTWAVISSPAGRQGWNRPGWVWFWMFLAVQPTWMLRMFFWPRLSCKGQPKQDLYR